MSAPAVLRGTKAELAKGFFEEGCSCSQAVLLAFAPECGLDRETALRLASSFGGGFGRLRELCGAVSSMGIVLGLLYGYTDLGDKDAKMRHYEVIQRLSGRFREEKGALRCGELLAAQQGAQGPEPADRTPQYYHARPCGDLVALAAALLEEEIAARSAAQ